MAVHISEDYGNLLIIQRERVGGRIDEQRVYLNPQDIAKLQRVLKSMSLVEATGRKLLREFKRDLEE